MQDNIREVPVDEISFDLYNPRLVATAKTQQEAIEEMLHVEAKSCVDLLKHIVTHGQLSPTDNMILLKEAGGYTVLEGNRRLIALKLLKNDEAIFNALPEQELKNQVKRILEKDSPTINSVRAFIVDQRVEAEPWIQLKHSRGQGGASTKHWGPFQKARDIYTQDPDKCPKELAFFYAAMDIQDQYPGLKEYVDNVYLHNFSFLERLTDFKDFRTITEITFRNNIVESSRGAKYLHKFIYQVFHDISKKQINSRAGNSNDQMAQYLENIVDSLQSITQENITAQITPSIPPNKPTASEPSSNSPKSTINKSKQKELFEKPQRTKRAPKQKALAKCTINNLGEKICTLIEEIQTLQLKDHPETISIAYRVLLDLACAYYSEQKEKKDEGNLIERILHVLEDIDPTCSTPPKRVQQYTELQSLYMKLKDTSAKLFQMGPHSYNVLTLPEDLKKYDSYVRQLLVAVDKKLGQDTLL